MRIFIAVDIDRDIRGSLERFQDRIRREVRIERRDAKFVDPKNMHLTLKFIGEVRDEKVTEVCDLVGQAVTGLEAFELEFAGVGSFGGRSPRVIWVGTGKGNDKLKSLAANIADCFERAGWGKEEREFAGHLTLCRIKNTKAGFQIAKAIEPHDKKEFGTVEIAAVKVYRSELTKQGPIYTVVAEHKLQ